MRVAVTGAFGFIGSNLVQRLLRDNHEIVLLSHKNRNANDLPSSASIVQGDVDNTDSLKSAFNGCDIVYHLVGIIAETKTKTFEKTVAQGTANVASAAKSSGVKQIVYLSAMGTSPEAPSKYHQTKYKAEQTIINSGIPYTILRPSLVFGEGDGFVSMLVKMINMSPFLPVIGDGRYRMQPVYITDLTEAMAKAATLPAVQGKIIEIGGPEKLEYLQILNILTTVLNKKRFRIHLPYALMRFMAGVLESIMKPAPLTKDQLVMMKMGNTGDITEMKQLLNIEPVQFEDGLKTYMR